MQRSAHVQEISEASSIGLEITRRVDNLAAAYPLIAAVSGGCR